MKQGGNGPVIASRGGPWLRRSMILPVVSIALATVVFARPFGDANSPVGEAAYTVGPPVLILYALVLTFGLCVHRDRAAIDVSGAEVALHPFGPDSTAVPESDVIPTAVVSSFGMHLILFKTAGSKPRVLSISSSQILDVDAFEALLGRLRTVGR